MALANRESARLTAAGSLDFIGLYPAFSEITWPVKGLSQSRLMYAT